MITTIIGIICGGIISWIISRKYHMKSNQCPPDWAIPLIEKLPKLAPTDEEFLNLFQDEISIGNIKPHPVFSIVACPNCGAPLKELEERAYGDDVHTILEIECPQCG